MNKNCPILVTGAAGFIGFHLTKRLLNEGYSVVGLDSMNDYYDVSLKEARLSILNESKHFTFYQKPLEDIESLINIFDKHKFEIVINLAAQAGVRYSLTNPHAYTNSNIVGFLNLLESSRHNKVKHLIYASSSSVYGANESMPFKVKDTVDHPISLYAATKKSNELMAHSYASNFNLPVTGLRFFTVYGPWGRPDMALFLFTKAILNDEPINVFNNGNMKRDFTFVEDIVEGIFRLLDKPPKNNQEWDPLYPDPATSYAPYQLFNIGNSKPVLLMDFIKAIESSLNKEAKLNFMPIQPGDVPATYADTEALAYATGYRPKTTIEEGVGKFVDWYKGFYRITQ